MAVDHDHIRSMTVVFVTNGPMRGINLCERAVAVTIGLTNLEHEGVVAPAAGYHLRQLPPQTVVKLFARNSGIGKAKPSHLVSNN